MAKASSKSSSEEKGLAVRPASSYAICLQGAGKVAEIIKANTGGIGVREFDLPRITWPSGKTLVFTIPSITGDKMAESIQGVIVGFKDVRVYWEASYEESQGGPPDCSSNDCVTGSGNPGGVCSQCPLSAFKKTPDEKGSTAPDCSQRRVLFVAREKSILPLVVTLPPTSLKPCMTYFLGLAGEALPYWSVITTISLAKEKNAKGVEYGEARFSLAAQLAAEEAAQFKAAVESLRSVFSGVRPAPISADQSPAPTE